ncbi:MAG: rod-binding protein [SAR324 cluster bacterium]|nr:rod-binding protein [SAR324 cluster bacterium]MBL7036041.1 rod-binding protein [SAR324 cluster bacterium]
MKASIPLPLSALTLKANQLRELPKTKGINDDAKLRETANEFEAIFIKQMLKSMRKSTVESELLPKSEGEKLFRSMLDEQYARLSAKSGSLGLGEMIYQQLKVNLDNK